MFELSWPVIKKTMSTEPIFLTFVSLPFGVSGAYVKKNGLLNNGFKVYRQCTVIRNQIDW